MADNVQVLSMTQAQIINKILSTKKLDIITENAFNENYFPAYRSEFNFIMDHYNNYNAIPDLVTFIQRFPNFDLFEVTETDKYLAEVLSEEYRTKVTRMGIKDRFGTSAPANELIHYFKLDAKAIVDEIKNV